MSKIADNYDAPDATVEFFFVEHVPGLNTVISGEQVYLAGFINLFLSGERRNADLESFRGVLASEIDAGLKDLGVEREVYPERY